MRVEYLWTLISEQDTAYVMNFGCKNPFPCSSGLSRPIRLSETTRRFAYESLLYKYGLDTKKTPSVSLDGIDGFEGLSPLGQYDAAIQF